MGLYLPDRQLLHTVEPAPGIYDGIAEEDYHASPGVSVSRLKRFRKLPALAHLQRKETSSLRFGSLIHSVLLTPEVAEQHYVINDDSRNSNAFKAAKKAADEGGQELVYTKQWEEALRVRDSVMSTSVGRDLLSPAGLKTEQSFYWRDRETGMLLRGRADIVREDFEILADLKSCQDASPEAFSRTISDYAYDWQRVMYQDGFELAQQQSVGLSWQPQEFIFLAIESEEPYLCHPMVIARSDLEKSRIELRDTINRYHECEMAGKFNGYPGTLTEVEVTHWARKQRDPDQVPDYHDPRYVEEE